MFKARTVPAVSRKAVTKERAGRRAEERRLSAPPRDGSPAPTPTRGPSQWESMRADAEFVNTGGGIGEDILRVADIVARIFERKDAPGDIDDWRQAAALAIVADVRYLQRKNPAWRYNTNWPRAKLIAQRTIALEISKSLAVVNVTEWGLRQDPDCARNAQDRTPLIGCGYGEREFDGESGTDSRAIDLAA